MTKSGYLLLVDFFSTKWCSLYSSDIKLIFFFILGI